LDSGSLESLAPVLQTLVGIQLAAVVETFGPGEDGGDAVGASGIAFLVFSPVAGHGAMGSLGLHGDSIGSEQFGSHEA